MLFAQVAMAKSDPALLLLLLLVSAVALQTQPILAQQEYNNVTGYLCTGVQQKCAAYAYYRTQGTNSTLNSTAALFSTTAAAIASASNRTATSNALLADMTGLTIPLSCGCANGTYQAPTNYTILPDDTMSIIANRTFEGLVSYQAIMAANPSVTPELMMIGDDLIIPVRCACPSQQQIMAGTESLLSYAVFPNENLQTISNMYNVSVAEVQAANMLPNNTIEAFSTVLVPLKGSGNTSSIAPGPSPNAASAVSRADALLVVAVAALLAAQSLLF